MQQSNHLKLLIGALLAVLLLAGMAYSMQNPGITTKLPFMGPTPTPTPLVSKNIIVYTPRINDHVSQIVVVKGKARVFENIVSIRLKEKLSGKVFGVITTTTNAKDMGTFGEFQAGISLNDQPLIAGTDLILEVFQASPKDGRDMDTITIPVRFSPSANQ